MWNKGVRHLQHHLKLKSTAESGRGGTPRTSMRSSWQELTPRRPSSFGLGWPTPKLSPGPSWLAGNRSRAWAPLSCPVWWPMAMGDYGALEMWLIWNESCCEGKTHIIFWRQCKKKKKACKMPHEDVSCWLHLEVIALGSTGLDEMHCLFFFTCFDVATAKVSHCTAVPPNSPMLP